MQADENQNWMDLLVTLLTGYTAVSLPASDER